MVFLSSSALPRQKLCNAIMILGLIELWFEGGMTLEFNSVR